MKFKKSKVLLMALALAFALVSVIGVIGWNQEVSANIAPANRGIVFPYLFSGDDWNAGFNQDTPLATGAWVEFDVTQVGTHSFQMVWTRADTRWRGDGGFITYLEPTNPSRLNVEVAAITIDGEPWVSNMVFGRRGTFWNNAQTTIFGNIPVPADSTVTSIPGYTIRTLNLQHLLGPVSAGSVVEIAIRVGPRPSAALDGGDVNQDNIVNAQDATWIRRIMTAVNPAQFITERNLSESGANVAGLGVGTNASLQRLRQYLAGIESDPSLLAQPEERYFIAFTFDDGPNGVITTAILDGLLALNNRPGVVCGRNGVDACAPGIGCGTVCGTQSRAKVTFYPMGVDGFQGGAGNPGAPTTSPALIRRMLQEGHAVDNHTENHNISPSTGIIRPGPEGTDSHGPQFSTRTHIENQMLLLHNRINASLPAGFTDFYGNVFGPGNPHTSFSFRPNHFTMSRDSHGVDTASNLVTHGPGGMPWIFGMIDPWDWTGHGASFMSDFLIYGALDWCGGSPSNQHCCTHINANPSTGFGFGQSPTRPPGLGVYPLTGWCAIRNSSYSGAADGGANGGVVLLHDGGLGWPRQPTVDVVLDVIPRLQAMGYHIVTVEQLFYYMDAEPEWIPSGMLPLWDGARQFNLGMPYSYWNAWTGAGAPMSGDDRGPGPREGQGSQFGVNGFVRRDQGDRAAWMAETGYVPNRIRRAP